MRGLGALLLLPVACTAPPGQPPPDAGPPLSWSDACTQLESKLCAAYAQCKGDWFTARYGGTDGGCLQARVAECVELRQAPGNLTTSNALAQCAAALGTPSCDTLATLDELSLGAGVSACRFIGTSPEGTFCIDDGQCAGGSCAHFQSEACGTCVTRSAALPCFVDAECLSAQVCQFGRCVPKGALDAGCDLEDPCLNAFVCRDGRCDPRGKKGDPCDASLQDCAPGLTCGAMGCEAVTYVSAMDGGAPDAPCIFDDDCGLGLRCLEGSCGTFRAARCAAPQGGTPSSTYPARMPSVPSVGSIAAPPVVLSAPKLVLVTFQTDPNASALAALVPQLASSTTLAAATMEYGVGAPAVLPAVISDYAVPSRWGGSLIRPWLAQSIGSGAPWPPNDGNTVYALVIPAAVASGDGNLTACAQYLGYHSSLDVNGVATPFAVVSQCLPELPSATLSHELIESVTDPLFDPDAGYYTGYDVLDSEHLAWGALVNNSELADLCDNTPYARVPDPKNGVVVQRSWSNRAIAAFHSPCVPAPAGQPFLAAVPPSSDDVPIVFEGIPQTTQGISIAVGSSKTVQVDLLSDGPSGGPWRVTAYDVGVLYGVPPVLHFRFDKQLGQNGDHLMLTLTVDAQNPTYGAEPFVLVSRRGRVAHFWFGVVGNP